MDADVNCVEGVGRGNRTPTKTGKISENVEMYRLIANSQINKEQHAKIDFDQSELVESVEDVQNGGFVQ